MPNLLIMDEPDVFLDFSNINSLCRLINSYQGTMLVITHNRYLLNHCFNKILHLENTDIQEFDGNYTEYNFALLQKKIELQELAAADQEEIERTEKMVERIALMQAIEKLPDRENMVIKLRYFHGLTQQRTARILDVSQVQVSRIEKKAIQALKELMS